MIAFDEVASTTMVCADVDTWLLELDTARIDGDTLLSSDASGAEIRSLTKATQ